MKVSINFTDSTTFTHAYFTEYFRPALYDSTGQEQAQNRLQLQ
jgi:hypothetical protein